MKYLQIVNAALAALGLTCGVVMMVVLVMYAAYLDETPRLVRDLPLLGLSTAAFTGAGLIAGLAFLGHRGARVWAWPMQAAMVIGLLGVALVLQLYRS